MKNFLIVLAIWLLLSFLVVPLIGGFVKFIRARKRHRPQWDGSFTVSTGAKGGGDELTTKYDTPRESNILFFAPKKVPKMSSLQLLTEKYITQLKALETQMADVKHKLEIVTEASRFLEEEGLSEDGPSSFTEKTY